MSVLQLDSVSLAYGEHRVLSDVYLSIRHGEIVGLLGRNGSGKSSLLKILFGVLPEALSHVKVGGAYFSEGYLSGQLCFVPQDGFAISYLTPVKMANLFQADTSLLLKDEIVSRFWKQPFGDFSGGEAKYIEMMIALFSPRKFILLDEPFSYLSPVLVDRLKEILLNLSKEKGIILTDHQYRHVLEVSTRLFILSAGRLQEIAGIEDLREMGISING